MLRSLLKRCVTVRLPTNKIVIRCMATNLKDYTTYYEILDIPAESTKVQH